MVRTIGQLKALDVMRATAPGLYPDGGGLYLQVGGRERPKKPGTSPEVTDDEQSGTDGQRSVTKSWVFRYMLRSRARMMGLGPLRDVPLAFARKRAAECRLLCHDGVDPVEARKAGARRAQLEAARAMTFQQSAEAYIASHKAAWRSPQEHGPVGSQPSGLCLSDCRRAPRAADRYRARYENRRADLGRES